MLCHLSCLSLHRVLHRSMGLAPPVAFYDEGADQRLCSAHYEKTGGLICASDRLMPTWLDLGRARIAARWCFRLMGFFPRNVLFVATSWMRECRLRLLWQCQTPQLHQARQVRQACQASQAR